MSYSLQKGVVQRTVCKTRSASERVALTCGQAGVCVKHSPHLRSGNGHWDLDFLKENDSAGKDSLAGGDLCYVIGVMGNYSTTEWVRSELFQGRGHIIRNIQGAGTARDRESSRRISRCGGVWGVEPEVERCVPSSSPVARGTNSLCWTGPASKTC